MSPSKHIDENEFIACEKIGIFSLGSEADKPVERDKC